MARKCYMMNLNGEVYKLRLTMAGQKVMLEGRENENILSVIMGAVDDLNDMDKLLTQALNWEGNSNKIHTGAELYDEMVDAGYCGTEDFLKVCLNIAKNAGLLTQDYRDRLERIVGKLAKIQMDMMMNQLDDEAGEVIPPALEGEDSVDNPLDTEEPQVTTL